ncbi:hypothetical protein P343_09030 [Sporolactobacillus laevolacticus DSM 442]|uniref:Uncharacterized protein n=1 Tax=Sporolactobacillus laevolacticus DSM 442 TaxID=1395513 RepID=V6IYV7_9BACL|nr:hypothetical protein P343_09030 [Sporolactobacillus laevolacticus DSM 442]
MDACPHYNGYRSALVTRKLGSGHYSVRRIKCPVCHADIEVIFRDEVKIKKIAHFE